MEASDLAQRAREILRGGRTGRVPALVRHPHLVQPVVAAKRLRFARDCQDRVNFAERARTAAIIALMLRSPRCDHQSGVARVALRRLIIKAHREILRNNKFPFPFTNFPYCVFAKDGHRAQMRLL